MKKLLSAALVLAMGVTALTGCNVAAQGEDQPRPSRSPPPLWPHRPGPEGPQVRVPVHRRRHELSPDPVHQRLPGRPQRRGLLAGPASLDDNQGAILDGPEYLNFMNFEAAGSAVTYDSNSFAPDSASTATSLATGYKTYSGSINVDETGTVEYETIAEKLHSQKGYSVGVITSVNLNHATPAAFYAHQASRNDYYDIGLELVESGFEYFAGGGLLDPTGAEGDQTNLYTWPSRPAMTWS